MDHRRGPPWGNLGRPALREDISIREPSSALDVVHVSGLAKGQFLGVYPMLFLRKYKLFKNVPFKTQLILLFSNLTSILAVFLKVLV